MRFHVINLPHTQVTKEYCWCAYTSKVLRFCNMMSSLGHEVFLYAGTQNEAKVTEFITIVTDEDRQKWFGNDNWDNRVFDQWDRNAECWTSMASRAAAEISQRKQPGDFLCLIAGLCQEDILKRLPDMRCVEWGVGYEGILKDSFHVFESQAWMHYLYGRNWINDGRFFDQVIPNSFEEDEFLPRYEKEDFLLYLGRPTPRKGLEVVAHLAKSHTVIMAGQGDPKIPGVKHIGIVRGQEKAELLARAKAVLVPTFYIEPFGGVAVEAMLSGTPVITTDFGAFTETVIHGVDGFRCHTLGEFSQAVKDVENLDFKLIRSGAEYYLTKRIRFEYERYFERLQLLDGKGWYE